MVADLVGTWAITPDSREYLPQSGSGSEARLVLKANGEFSASQLPGGLLRLEERPPLVNGGGTWKLLSDKPEQILLEFHMLTDARPGELPFGAQLFVSGGNSELFYYKGDPDEGIRIRFTQIR